MPRILVIDGNENIRETLSEILQVHNYDVESAADLRAVEADPGNIEQIIMSLAVNARDAMPGGGVLTLGTRNVSISHSDRGGMPGPEPGEYACLEVSDTGVGMSEETQKRVFDPFFTTKEAGKGTGLGLSTVYAIVRQHGGWVHLYSEEGLGTTFKIYLPACEVSTDERRAEQAGPSEFQGSGQGILVVEDNDDMREWCSIALGESGFEVFEASDAAAGHEQFRKHADAISLVISDVIMPDKSGLQLADELRAARPSLKVVLSSGYTGEKSGWDQIRQKGYGFLQKPYTMVELLGTVRSALSEGAAAG